MPTVPTFADDDERISWLRKWFISKNDLEAHIAGWDQTAQRYDVAVTGAGWVATAILTVSSTVQSALTVNSEEHTPGIALSYMQTAVGCCVALIGAVCKIGSLQNTKAAAARKEFPAGFFAAHAPATIWTGDISAEEKANCCLRKFSLC